MIPKVTAAFVRSLVLLLLMQAGFLFAALGQTIYGNEWIIPGQNYYKIPVGKSGIHVLSFDKLRAAGIPLAPAGDVQPGELQLFFRGKEQAIYINNDTLFFYGRQNDGTLDSLLYDPYSAQPHKYYNLYSDTTACFLTWAKGATGKRMNTISVTSASAPAPYHLDEILQLWTNEYDMGSTHYGLSYMTAGDVGEGWMESPIRSGKRGDVATRSYLLVPRQVYTGGPDATVEVMLIGRNGSEGDNSHHVDINLQEYNGSQSMTVSAPAFSFHDVKKVSASVPVSLFSKSALLVNIQVKDIDSTLSAVSVAYNKVTYPQNTDMQNQTEKYFNFPPLASATNASIINSLPAVNIFDITDPYNVSMISSAVQGTVLNTALPASDSLTRLYAVNPAAYISPAIQKADLNPYPNFNTAGYIVISHTKLMEGARAYTSYRASLQGGSYDTLLADVTKLYNMFSYGERTPVAIKRFMAYLSVYGQPQYLFIVGKGLATDYFTDTEYYRKNPGRYINNPDPENRREDLVPTYGVPGSDLLYSAGLKGNPKYVPAIPTGRVSAKNNQEVMNYLKKVLETDTTSKALWRKNLIHLSGGQNEGEVNSFRGFVNELKSIVQDTLFGGRVVHTYSQKAGNVLTSDMLGNIAEDVNNGVSYITFFGHSAAGRTDLDIGFVSEDFIGYRNKGRYPMLFINGCASGNMFLRYSFPEDWIITADRGAVNALAHTDEGLPSILHDYSTIFYKNAFQKRSLLGKPVGDVHLAAVRDFYNYYGAMDLAVANLQQMTLQGDPAMRLYSPKLPDYQITQSDVSVKSLDGRVVTAVSDSFAIMIAVSNLGIDFKDSVKISIQRSVNGKVTTFPSRVFAHISYRDTLVLVIKSPDVSNYGDNVFEIVVDPQNQIAEGDETNNSVSFHYFMPLSGVTPLLPQEYSIVNRDSVTLIAQSTNLLIGAQVDYYMEIDTSYSFSSPYKREAVITGSSLVKWKSFKLPLLKDSVVYYWRVRYNIIPSGEDTLWGESSFIYIPNSPEGWSQSEFPQFYKDGLNQVVKNIPSRQWEFAHAQAQIYLRAAGFNYVRVPSDGEFPEPGYETTIQVNGNLYEFRARCDENSLLALTFDRSTLIPYSVYLPADGGSLCGVPGRNILNIFDNLIDSSASADPQSQTNLMTYIDRIPKGVYAIFISHRNARFSEWGQALKNKFKTEFGAKYLDSLQSGMPYILVVKKGNPVPVYEGYKSASELIEYTTTFNASYQEGSITSTLIGPAESWGTFYHTVIPSEVPVTDSYTLKIIGVNINGSNADTLSIPQNDALDLSAVPGLNQYPYIRLLAEVKDSVHLTPPQLKKWQVIYSGIPEGTMAPERIGLTAYNPRTTGEGDSIKLCYAFENISGYDFKDSLTVKYTITNSSGIVKTSYAKIRPLKADSVDVFCAAFSTVGLVGTNVLQAYVNPMILKEQYYNNNVLETSITINRDNTHPILDVAVDGRHIMEGDIVSPSPLITITLNDENPYQIRNSTDGIEVYLQRPGDPFPQSVNLSGSDIISARQIGSNSKNVYQIQYNPKGLPDGVYTIVVKAKDVSGNSSGVADYRISFEVINESTITNFYPYPNPFSSSTRFVFTVTGNEAPQDLKIQIMTVTGKVVREITKAEIGPVHIGNNKTDFAWDGTDEFGDKLANGVYLYRVILKNGDEFKHRDTAADKAFRKGFGKVYILR